MTVSTTSVLTQFNGDGNTTQFSFGFLVLKPEDLTVQLLNTTGSDITFNNTTIAGNDIYTAVFQTDYDVSLSDPGGDVDFGISEAPPSGLRILIARRSSFTQDTDYIPGDAFPANSHEQALDKLTLLAQESNELAGRAVRLSPLDQDAKTLNPILPFKDERKGKVLTFDNNGAPSVSKDLPAATVTNFAETILDDNTASEVRTTISAPPESRLVNTGTGITGGGDLSQDRTLAVTAQLQNVVNATVNDGTFLVGDGNGDLVAESGSTARSSLGLGSIATQNASSVSITGGSISGINDLAVDDGGTGASTASGARSNLGLGSLATQNSVDNSDWSGTDLAVANGGTGASSASGARSNLNVERQRDIARIDRSGAGGQNINNTTSTEVDFTNSVIDTQGGIVDLANNKLVMPSGARFAIVYAGCKFNNLSGGSNDSQTLIDILLNGTLKVRQRNQQTFATEHNSCTGPIKVNQGDEFKLELFQASGGSGDITGSDENFLAVEVIY